MLHMLFVASRRSSSVDALAQRFFFVFRWTLAIVADQEMLVVELNNHKELRPDLTMTTEDADCNSWFQKRVSGLLPLMRERACSPTLRAPGCAQPTCQSRLESHTSAPPADKRASHKLQPGDLLRKTEAFYQNSLMYAGVTSLNFHWTRIPSILWEERRQRTPYK